jgi:hypothetical protein
MAFVAMTGLLLLAWRWLASRRDRQARETPLVFDDAAPPAVLVLGLEWRAAADRKAETRPA